MRTSGLIVVVKFVRPIDVNVDKLWEGAPDFVGSARTDPDGSAIRLALARKATPNVMVAGERLFIDLLPDTWSGSAAVAAAGCHQGIGRTREGGGDGCCASGMQRSPQRSGRRSASAPRRSRPSRAIVFELPDGAGVSTILNKERLTLNFDSGLTFDLADAKVARRAEHFIDHPEDRRREHGGRVLADRRCRRAFVPRGEELRRRHRFRDEAGHPAEARSAQARGAAAGHGAGPPYSARARSFRRLRVDVIKEAGRDSGRARASGCAGPSAGGGATARGRAGSRPIEPKAEPRPEPAGQQDDAGRRRSKGCRRAADHRRSPPPSPSAATARGCG